MSNTQTHRGDHAICKASASTSTRIGIIPALILAFIALVAPSVKADTAMAISTVPTRIFGAAGAFTNVIYPGYSNALTSFTLTGDTNPIDLYVTGAPAGVTAGFSTNSPSVLANIFPMIQVTNSITAYLEVVVSNAPKGLYTLTIVASNEFNTLIISTNTLLILPNVFAGGTVDTNWSTPGNWSLGSVPLPNDDVKFQKSSPTNSSFDTSVTLDSLSYLSQSSAVIFSNFFAPNITVAVSGTNGFWAGYDGFVGGSEKNTSVAMNGISGSLVVTNPSAVFSMWDMAGSGGTKSTFNFGGLGNLYVDVSRFGGGDTTLMAPNVAGVLGSAGQVVDIFFARTNFIHATYVGDFGGTNPLAGSLTFFNNNQINNGSASTAQLGITNAIYADSVVVAANTAGAGANTLKFNAAFITASNPVAVFRGPSGGNSRMSFFGVGIDSGLAVNGNRTRGVADFTGGKVDMRVDTMWLGHNKTNFTGLNQQIGNLTFTSGTIDVNTLRAGYKQFPTTNMCQSTITVNGTNSTLVINNTLELGFTAPATLVVGDGTTQTKGELFINSNAVVRANLITVGNFSTNNRIVMTTGGHLIVSNTIASSATSLALMNVNGSKITFLVTAGVTNAFVTNLICGANATVVNIASLSGFSPTVPATNVVIAYQDSFASHNLSIGSLPAGFNNISLIDNLASKTIELRIATNAPAVLKWRGGENSNWDHTSLNWLNTNTLAITRFFDGDRVIFDDSAVVPTTISVTETINPGQVGTGIFVSNSVNAFIFNDGGGSFGNCSLVKAGTNSLQINAVAAGVSAQINSGKLTGSGTVAGATIAAGASMDFAGTLGGVLQVAGSALLNTGGNANNTVNVQNGGVMTNSGTIKGGGLVLDSGSLLVNAAGGNLLSIGNSGAVNVATNATLVNLGTIGSDDGSHPNSLNVNGTFRDSGLGNIYLTTFTLGGTFLPGGDGIGTTEIKTATVGSSFPGRMTLLAGSTTLIKVNFANAQTNTVVIAQFTDFGGNSSVKAFDGGTILFTNINTGAGVFALGQSFRVFTGPGGADIGNEGLNTTNRYPIVNPVIPAANTKWDLTSLRDTSPNGILNIVGFPTTGTNITVSTFADGGNIVTHLQWPSEYIGWRLQQQTNPLTVGIWTNWTTVSGSAATNDIYITNSATIDTSFFRMIYP